MKYIALLAILCATATAPAGMDTQIAGRKIDHFGYEALYDPFAKTYLYWALDCDGAHRRLTLTTSLESIGLNEGWNSPKGKMREEFFAEKRNEFEQIPINAQTGLGIKLGMTRKQVVHKLGIPSQSLYSERFKADELIYQRYTPKDKRGWYGRYANFYLFRNDMLFYIELSCNLIGGGCGWERGTY